MVLVGVPIVILFGWIHFKQIGTFSAQQNITVEMNPYNYKPHPGFQSNVIFPIYHEITKLLIKKINDKQLSDDDKHRLDDLEKDLLKLMKGGHVGNPPRGAF